MKPSSPVCAINVGNMISIVVSTCPSLRVISKHGSGTDTIDKAAEPRITLSPHIGGVTAEAYVKMGVAAARNALDVLNA